VLGIRKLPDYLSSSSSSTEIAGGVVVPSWDWIVLQAGNSDDYYPRSRLVIGDYWTGNDGYGKKYFQTDQRPDRIKSRYSNNQGGWMGTKRQIIEWHLQRCNGGFLPPYNEPVYPWDGLDKRTVEYWSGGGHLFGVKSCNLQRIITLDPDGFSRHLLYHTSNNKQRASTVRRRFASQTVDELWGQLNAVRIHAQERMKRELSSSLQQ